MIMTRTPLRVSFCGGGSDLPSFYKRHEGHVVSTTIDKYIYLTLERSFNADTTYLKYSTVEKVQDIGDIHHPIFRECLKMYGVSGVEINSTADIPGGTGMGSSSSFTVGLINLLRAFQGKNSEKDLLAKESCIVETDILNEPIGKQDQYAAAYGGLNYYHFHRNGDVTVEPIELSKGEIDRMNQKFLLFYTGGVRNASDILREQNNSTEKKDNNQLKMCSLALKLKDNLNSGDVDSVGPILSEGWKLKRELTDEISNSKIDEMYETGMENGALGGKLLGAGGAGFMLFYADRKDHGAITKALSAHKKISFKMISHGSTVAFTDEN